MLHPEHPSAVDRATGDWFGHSQRFLLEPESHAKARRRTGALYILNMDVLNGSLRTRRPDAAKIALQSAGSAEG